MNDIDRQIIAGANVPKMRRILAEVATEAGLTIDEIKARTRRRDIVRPRQLSWAKMREAGFTFHQIANFFAMDHSTIVDGVKRIKAERRKVKREMRDD